MLYYDNSSISLHSKRNRWGVVSTHPLGDFILDKGWSWHNRKEERLAENGLAEAWARVAPAWTTDNDGQLARANKVILLKIESRGGYVPTGTVYRSTRLFEFRLLATQKNSQLILALLWRTRKAVRRDMYVSEENVSWLGQWTVARDFTLWFRPVGDKTKKHPLICPNIR